MAIPGELKPTRYRQEIDGLRAISVLLVIAFHAGLPGFAAGFIGVDVFFVISGFLITGIIIAEQDEQNFSLLSFYKRRAARLIPALFLVLLATYISGFILYDELVFDRVGKQIAFSSCGAANLLFAQGSNYFTQDPRAQPLLHLWSLGVEEQFYFVWPAVLLLFAARRRRLLLAVMAICALGSLLWAEFVARSEPIEAYFYPQYRAFELLLGGMGAVIQRHPSRTIPTSPGIREILTGFGMACLIGTLFLLDHSSTFPGFNTVPPCVGTLLVLLFGENTRLAFCLQLRPLVVVGLMSYPLYLFHYPLITFARHCDPAITPTQILWLVLLVAVPFSYATYRYCEKPIQRLIRQAHPRAKVSLWVLLLSLGALGGLGLLTAKLDGLPGRFAHFNPFALEVTERNRPPFFAAYPQGVVLCKHPQPEALFLGDSVLQQYVPSLVAAFGIDSERFDLVTRSGCVLLKGADFKDPYSTIPRRDLYAYLYGKLGRTYRYVFISQDWNLYDGRIGNFDPVTTGPAITKWKSLIDATIRHHQQPGTTVVLLGSHPIISGTDVLSPNLLLTKERYRSLLPGLAITNLEDLPAARQFFTQWHHPPTTVVLHPSDLWLDQSGRPELHDGNWPYFFDSRHIGSGSVGHATKRLIPLVRPMIPRVTPP